MSKDIDKQIKNLEQLLRERKKSISDEKKPKEFTPYDNWLVL